MRGENRTDVRPLAQIPPLHGVAALDLERPGWRATVTVRWAPKQDRVDADPASGSGLDYGPTPGHAVVDLEAAVPLAGGLEVLVGADNLMDRVWAEHLNRSNLFDPDPLRVNEPGRTGWLRLRWTGAGTRPAGP